MQCQVFNKCRNVIEMYTLMEASLSGMHGQLTSQTGSRSVLMKGPEETRKLTVTQMLPLASFISR